MTGDALIAEEPAQAKIETPEAPKPTKVLPTNKPTNDTAERDAKPFGDATTAVIALADRIKTAEAAETPAAARASDLVTVRAKPEKRKNYKERAKAKFTKDDTKEDSKDDSKDVTRDGTTPMTATAKSGVSRKAADKANDKANDKAGNKAEKAEKAKEKAALKAQKADTKAAKIKAAKTAKAARMA